MFKKVILVVLSCISLTAKSGLLDFESCVRQLNNASGQVKISSDLIVPICREKVIKAQKLESDFGSTIESDWISFESKRETDGTFNQLKVINNTKDKTLKYIRLVGGEMKQDKTHVWFEKTGKLYYFKVNIRPGAIATLMLPATHQKKETFKIYVTGREQSMLDRVSNNDKFSPVSPDPLSGIDLAQ